MHSSPGRVSHPPAVPRTGFRWSACLALGVLLIGAAYTSGGTGEGEPDLAAAYQPDPATMEQVRAAAASPELHARGEAVLAQDPESRVREVYRNYAEKVRASGHDLTFELSNFQTILAERYAEHRWLDFITLNVGSRLKLTSGGADAPWLEEPIIFFEPSWEEFNPGAHEATDWRRQVLKGRSVLEVMGLLIEEGDFHTVPPAITTYRVRLQFEEHHRTYQASVIWVEDAEGQLHEPYYFDDIVSRLTDIDDQGSRIVTPEGWEELYGSPMRPD